MSKLYLRYIILFLTLIFLIDFGSGQVLRKIFINIYRGDYGVINSSLQSNAEVLILGSSRAEHHYNPSIFNEVLGISCYNAGLGGHGIFFNYAILSEIISRKKPRIVILDLSPNIIVDVDSYSKLNLLLPYYNKNEPFREIVQLNPKFSKLEVVSNLYVYNSTIYDILRSVSFKSKSDKLGYKPLEGKIDKNNFFPFSLKNNEIDYNKITYLTKIIDLCIQNKIRLIGVVSPTYQKFDESNIIIDSLEAILNKKNIEFYDYSDFSKIYQKPNYFKDQLHMNKIGTDIFSAHLSEKMQRAKIQNISFDINK